MSATVYSLAEIDAQCRKAARGAGCAWGIAEEAGRAARWLAAYGLPGPKVLAELFSGARSCKLTVPEEAGPWCADKPICPLPFGAALADRAVQMAKQGGMSASEVAWPLLMLPQAGRASEALGQPVSVRWDGFSAICMPQGLWIGEDAAMLSKVGTAFHSAPCIAAEHLRPPGREACQVDDWDWAILDGFAHRTYVPATEASRLAGAGAGLTDND